MVFPFQQFSTKAKNFIVLEKVAMLCRIIRKWVKTIKPSALVSHFKSSSLQMLFLHTQLYSGQCAVKSIIA